MFAYACGGCSGLFTVRYLTVVRGATRAGLTTSEREPERTERTHARFCNVIEPKQVHSQTPWWTSSSHEAGRRLVGQKRSVYTNRLPMATSRM